MREKGAQEVGLLLELAYNKWATLRESISSPPSEKVFAHQRGL